MKRLIAFISFLIMIVISFSIFTGCGENKDEKKKKEALSAAAGTYNGAYMQIVGDSTRIEGEAFSVILNEDGTGISNREGASYKVKWSINGTEFKMTETFAGISIDYNGTLENGKLDIFNGDKNDNFTYEYVYEKQ